MLPHSPPPIHERAKMTTIETTMTLRQRREVIVYEHAAAENGHDVEASNSSSHV